MHKISNDGDAPVIKPQSIIREIVQCKHEAGHFFWILSRC